MKRALALLVLSLAAGRVFAIPPACNTTGTGANALERAANNLTAGQACKLTTAVHQYQGSGSTFHDIMMPACSAGTKYPLTVYANGMAWDPVRAELYWIGTTHFSGNANAFQFVRYSAATNEWFVEAENYSTPLRNDSTCTGQAPAKAVTFTMSTNCQANHAYDNMAFDGRYMYFHDFQSTNVRRFDSCPPGATSPTCAQPSWNANWKTLPNSAFHTSQSEYWPEANAVLFGANNQGGISFTGTYLVSPATGTVNQTITVAFNSQIHGQTVYHPGTGEVLMTEGNGSQSHWRLTWNGSAAVASADLGTVGGVGMTFGITGSGYHCFADPNSTSESIFVCLNNGGDTGPITDSQWRVYNMTTDTASNLPTAASSMPPVRAWTNGGDGMPATIPEYGVIVFNVFQGSGAEQGMYVYKHSGAAAAAACLNGLDDDLDGATDFPTDTGCLDAADTSERGSIQCDDGVDNDSDGETDFKPSCNPATMDCDPDCTSIGDNIELGSIACGDGADNDGDGAIDMFDGGCSSTSDTSETGWSGGAPTAIATVTLKESAGVGATNWPTRVVVPLPQPGPTSITNYRVYGNTEADNVGRCDVVIEREWNADATPNDNAIRNIACDFRGTSAAAPGTRTYRIHSAGQEVGWGERADTGSALVASAAGVTTVTTGPVRFTMLGVPGTPVAGFNIFDTAFFNTDDSASYATGTRTYAVGERLINSSASNGGRLNHCDAPSGGACATAEADQNDSGLLPDSIVLEENNPMRAVLRVERYTRYAGINNLTHGYVVRIYAYAGDPKVKVDYQLVNAATADNGNTLRGSPTRWSDPFYFDSLNLDFALTLGTPQVRVGWTAGTVATQNPMLSTGAELAYTRHDNAALRWADGSTNYQTCTDAANNTTNDCDTAGFMDVSDGAVGVQVAMRNMWELWPSGFEINSAERLQVQMFPDWSAQWFSVPGSGGSLNATAGGPTAGVYWLDDMQAVYKELLFNFHGATPADATLTATARTFDRYPVPVVPASHYRATAVTLDLGGKMPAALGSDAPTALLETNTANMDETQATYRFGWQRWYAADPERVWWSEGYGDGPVGGEEFVATGSPQDYWNVERWVLGQLNTRPVWMGKDYTHAGDYSTLLLDQSPYGNSLGEAGEMHWRADGDPSGDGGSYPIGARWSESPDAQHTWLNEMESYWYSANPWIKDFLVWMGEYRRYRWVAHTGDDAERAKGEALSGQVLSYRVAGTTSYLTDAADWIRDYQRPQLSPKCGRRTLGDSPQNSSSSLEKGFLDRGAASLAAELKGKDWARWSQVFLMISSFEEWEQFYGGYAYNPDLSSSCTFGNSSSQTAWNSLDSAAWYYWNTGKTRFKTLNTQYANGGVNGGGRPYTATTPEGRFFVLDQGSAGYGDNVWDGRYPGRFYFFVDDETRPDAAAPDPVTDLAAGVVGPDLLVAWTPPANNGPATYYLVVYTTTSHLIEECTSACATDPESTNTASYRNWWALSPYVCTSTPCTVPGASGAIRVGVAPFDASDNMGTFATAVVGVAPGNCGDGVVNGTEQCDLGALNGDTSVCCTAGCGFRSIGQACGSSTDTTCTDPDTCAVSGTCQSNDVADGTDCEADGRSCTECDTCSGGVCMAGPTVCPDLRGGQISGGTVR